MSPSPLRSILRFRPLAVLHAAVLLVLATGCDPTRRFPAGPLDTQAHDGGRRLSYDTNDDKVADYWQILDGAGRVVFLEFDDDRDGTADHTVDLRQVRCQDVPHLIIALDGCPYDCVDEVYRAGGLRLFHEPVRMISCFPAMTDVALSRIWHCGPCRAYQALYFDRTTGRQNNGYVAYLKAENSPWVAKMAYRCSFWWDANAYLSPDSVFTHEMRGIDEAFKKVERGTAAGYTVGTAGLGTRGGHDAIVSYLRRVDRLCQQIVYERRGRVKLSVLADHGQGLKRCKRVVFKEHLARRGLNLCKRLDAPNDVVTVEYGLVTYAAFFTGMPNEVAQALRNHEAVELVFQKDGNNVVVMDAKGMAVIGRAEGGWRYEMIDGDPLKLDPILASLRSRGKVSGGEVIDDRALLEATATHEYPDPLHRAWWAFNGVTEVYPDVIASLRNGYSHGGAFFDFMIGGAASTHGAIDRLSSTSFVLTMRGELPGVFRLEDALGLLDRAGEGPVVTSTRGAASRPAPSTTGRSRAGTAGAER
ncbi:MAG: hypothetical protein JXQ73_04175 [Phycisphaerae bacterium]|nr:hypothetical protein [Phycisphaerae bacterium]